MTKEKQPNFDFDEIDSEIVDLGVNQERQGALEQTANSISTFCADQDSTCQGPLAKPELVPDSIEGLDEVEKHKARIRQKRKVTRFAMTLIVLSMLVSSVLIQELWRVPDEDLGLSALPPRQHRQTKSVVKSDNDTPEWLEQWHNYFKDREWYNANAEIMSAEHKRRPRASPAEIAVIHTEDHTTLEQRKRHRQSEEKALKIVSEVVEKHGSQYILATLLQADSLVAIGRIDEWEKRDPRIILAPLHNRYEVYKKILGVANPRTLYALRDLGYCYERINDNAKAQSIFRYGLKISEESFG